MRAAIVTLCLALAGLASGLHAHPRGLLASGLSGQSSQLSSEVSSRQLSKEAGTVQTDRQMAQLRLAATFGLWTQQHNKTYTSQEAYAARMQTFQSNVEAIDAHNAQDLGWTLAINQFADLTSEEFRATRLGLQPTTGGQFRERLESSPFRYSNATVPASVDWVAKGAVTPVKNQEQCGSCWAFSTTGSVEGANYLQTGQLVSLSEQELVDCDTSKDMGCGGGLMDFAFDFIVKNKGIDTEEDYGYWGMGTLCNPLREGRHVVTIDGHEDVPVNSEADLAKAVAHQPVSVAICADSLQFYSSGVLSKCCTGLDHGVLVVGYDTTEENGSPYWVVKNSWGSGWGENGYFRLAKDVPDKHGMCGLARVASYPVKTSPNPTNVPEVCGWLGWSECEKGSSCVCNFNLFGLVCLDWGCAVAH